MQAGEKVKSSLILQQLQTKQQQLMAQLQLAQHAMTLNMLIQTNKNEGVKGERDRHRSETQYSSDGSTKENQNNNNGSPLVMPGKINGARSSSSEETSPSFKSECQENDRENLLYSGGMCRWPGCDRECPSPGQWRLHMSQEHGLSEKSQAQARIQMQMVTELEVKLKQEKVRLAAMMKHLHPKSGHVKEDTSLPSPEPKRFRAESPPVAPLSLSNLPKMTVPELLKSSGQAGVGAQYPGNPLAHLMSLAPASQSMSPLAALNTGSASLSSMAGLQPHSPTSTPLRGTLHEKTTFTPLGGSGGSSYPADSHRRRVTHHDRGNPNLDPEEDLAKNREFYRVQDVRPPYTYAALIRQVGYFIGLIAILKLCLRNVITQA